MSFKENIIHINPGETKAEFYDEMGSCFCCSPNINVSDEDVEPLENKIENFVTIVKETLVGKTLSKVCFGDCFYNFDNVSRDYLNELDIRVVPFRVDSNIIFVVEENILYIDSGEEYASLKLNCESIDVIETECITPIELDEKYGYKGTILDLSWGFKDLLNKKVRDVYLGYIGDGVDSITIEFDNDFVIYCPLCSMEPIDCYKKRTTMK